METVSVAILALSSVSILFFLLYVAGLLPKPTGERPRTPTYDRFGRVIGHTENPGFEETEEEVRR
jgi:hypothetical protein